VLQSFDHCSICHKVAKREELRVYNFPTGPRLVCKECYRNLPPDPLNRIPRPPGQRKRGPADDIFPPLE